MIRCIKCAKANLIQGMAHMPGSVRGENFAVELLGLLCQECGYHTIEGWQMPDYMRLLADKYRTRHGLLTSNDIRDRRVRLGMTQETFAKYLDVEMASIKRWEMGKIQDQRSNDRILMQTSR